jgi:hypothetical protein
LGQTGNELNFNFDPQVIMVNREWTRMNANHDQQQELAPNDPPPRYVVEAPDGQSWLAVIRVYGRLPALPAGRQAAGRSIRGYRLCAGTYVRIWVAKIKGMVLSARQSCIPHFQPCTFLSRSHAWADGAPW